MTARLRTWHVRVHAELQRKNFHTRSTSGDADKETTIGNFQTQTLLEMNLTNSKNENKQQIKSTFKNGKMVLRLLGN